MRAPDMTPDPAVLEALRAARGNDQPSPAPAEPTPPEPAASEGVSVNVPVAFQVRVGTQHVAALLDAQTNALYNAMARTYAESRVHASTALYVLELLRQTILRKEASRLGVPGFTAPESS